MLNRAIAPTFSLPSALEITSSKTHKLSNGIPIQIVEGGTQDVLRITFLFNAGTRHQAKALIAATTLSMLTEGTKNHTANQLAELLDYYGAYTDQGIDRDKAGISLYCLGKHIQNLLPLLQEIILYPTFPEKQFETLINKKKQQLTVERQKVAYLAREQHQAMLTVKWTTHKILSFLTSIEIRGIDRIGIVAELTKVISDELNVNIRKLHIDSHEKEYVEPTVCASKNTIIVTIPKQLTLKHWLKR